MGESWRMVQNFFTVNMTLLVSFDKICYTNNNNYVDDIIIN